MLLFTVADVEKLVALAVSKDAEARRARGLINALVARGELTFRAAGPVFLLREGQAQHG